MSLEANYGWNFQQARDLDLSGADKGDYSVSISAGKNSLRFDFNPGFNINENEVTGDIEASYSFAIRKPLYPLVPSELARSYYKSEQDLVKARRSFAGSQLNAVLSLAQYLPEPERMESRLAIYQENS